MACTARLNSPLREFLRHPHQAEVDARGPERRVAFRRTREAIGAALAHGVPSTELAECLGVTVASIRNRAALLGATMSASEIRQFTTLKLNEAPRHPAANRRAPERRYRIADVVSALLASPD